MYYAPRQIILQVNANVLKAHFSAFFSMLLYSLSRVQWYSIRSIVRQSSLNDSQRSCLKINSSDYTVTTVVLDFQNMECGLKGYPNASKESR